MDPLLDYEPRQPNPQSMGRKIAIGIGASILVWLVIDELTTYLSSWVIGGAVVIGLGIAMRGNAQKRSQQLQIVLIAAACLAGWLLLIFLFSFFNAWLFLGLTAVLGAVVLYKEYMQRRRQFWLDAGCCGACGYDLCGTPDRCPECGRESILDEPTWRKLRREWGHIKPADEIEAVVELPAVPLPVVKVPTILKTPDFHEGPIPLEECPMTKEPAANEIAMTKEPNPNQ